MSAINARVSWLLLLPMLVIMLVVTGFPIANTVWLAFTDAELTVFVEGDPAKEANPGVDGDARAVSAHEPEAIDPAANPLPPDSDAGRHGFNELANGHQSASVPCAAGQRAGCNNNSQSLSPAAFSRWGLTCIWWPRTLN